MVSPVTWIIFSLAVISLGYAVYQAAFGRRINRWMMIFSAFVALWGVVAFGIFIVDTMWIDLVTAETIRTFCVRPTIMLVYFGLLAWLIRAGWHNDF